MCATGRVGLCYGAERCVRHARHCARITTWDKGWIFTIRYRICTVACATERVSVRKGCVG